MFSFLVGKKSGKNLTELTSRFYTLIPHDFGRQRPPVINNLELVREKMDMLLVRSNFNYLDLMLTNISITSKNLIRGL